MLDLPLLQRLSLVRRPRTQRAMGCLLALNYHWLPGVAIELENIERIPQCPVLFAMNHTDRYNYFPFQFKLWRRFDRFTATWVKGKYYESAFLARRCRNGIDEIVRRESCGPQEYEGPCRGDD